MEGNTLMRHNNRKFDKESYKANDQKAKDAMSNYLSQQGYSDIEQREDYFFDISAKKDKNYFFEVEIKNQWGEVWPSSWKEVRIPERKQRLINKWKKEYKDHELIFVVFNTSCSKAWFMDGDLVGSSTIGKIQNSSRIGEPHLQEPFFHIPYQEAELIQIN